MMTTYLATVGVVLVAKRLLLQTASDDTRRRHWTVGVERRVDNGAKMFAAAQRDQRNEIHQRSSVVHVRVDERAQTESGSLVLSNSINERKNQLSAQTDSSHCR